MTPSRVRLLMFGLAVLAAVILGLWYVLRTMPNAAFIVLVVDLPVVRLLVFFALGILATPIIAFGIETIRMGGEEKRRVPRDDRFFMKAPRLH